MTPKREFFHVFKFEDEFLIYDYYCSAVIETTQRMYEFLANRQLFYNDPAYFNERTAFEYLVDQGFLLHEDVLDELNENDSAYLSFAPSHRCNLRCRYCFAKFGTSYTYKEKDFTEETLHHMLDYFFFQVFPNRKNYRINLVSGGEPLVNFDIIKRTVEYCHELMTRKNVNIKIWLCTNGTLLSDEICDYLDKNKMTIGISIDGPQKIHDRNRIDIFGHGTYNKVISAIKQIQNSPTLSSRFKEIWGLSVFTDDIDLFEVLNHHKKVGLKNAQIKIERKIIDDDFNCEKYKNAYYLLMRQIIDMAAKGDVSLLRMILNEEDYLGKYILRIITNQYTTLRCNAGKCRIVICPNGDIYPCDSFIGIHEMKLGNIYTDRSISPLMESVRVNDCEPCKQCSLKYLCGGDCYYNSYINTGNIYTVQPQMCDILKYLCELSIWGCYHLQKEAHELFENLQKEMLRVIKIRHQI